MTTREANKILRHNRLAGIRPWSWYQLAVMRGCNRSVFSNAKKDRRRYRLAWKWVEETLGVPLDGEKR